MEAITRRRIQKKDVGCWFDGSHSSTLDLAERIVQLAESYGFVPSDPNWKEDDWNDWELYDALSYLNNEVVGNSDNCAYGGLQFEIEDNSLYLSDTGEE